jgi:hypothetical protein
MKKGFLVLTLLAMMTMVAATAMADSVTLTQGTFTANVDVTGNTATLSFGSGLNSYFTDQVAVHVADGAIVTGGTASSGTWTIQNGNNSVNCDGTGNWFCAVSASNVSFDGLTLTWNFTGGSLTDAISAQFAVCDSGTGGCQPGPGNFVTNFSQSGTPGTPTAPVPEPATLSLMGSGLLSLYYGRRWKKGSK